MDPDSGDTSSDDDNGTCIPDLVEIEDEGSTDSTHDDSEVKARIIYGCLFYLPYYRPVDSKNITDEYHYEYEIFSILRSAHTSSSVILAGKCGSRHQSTTSFGTNVVLAKTRYQM